MQHGHAAVSPTYVPSNVCSMNFCNAPEENRIILWGITTRQHKQITDFAKAKEIIQID
jgi:hypothetical protein